MSEIAEIEYAMSQLLRDLQSEGHIDNQFQQLLMLQDESEPDFVRSVMELFFQVRSCGTWCILTVCAHRAWSEDA